MRYGGADRDVQVHDNHRRDASCNYAQQNTKFLTVLLPTKSLDKKLYVQGIASKKLEKQINWWYVITVTFVTGSVWALCVPRHWHYCPTCVEAYQWWLYLSLVIPGTTQWSLILWQVIFLRLQVWLANFRDLIQYEVHNGELSFERRLMTFISSQQCGFDRYWWGLASEGSFQGNLYDIRSILEDIW